MILSVVTSLNLVILSLVTGLTDGSDSNSHLFICTGAIVGLDPIPVPDFCKVTIYCGCDGNTITNYSKMVSK